MEDEKLTVDVTVTLDITIELPGGDYTASAFIAHDDERGSMEKLQTDVTQALIDAGLEEIEVRLVADYLEFYSRYYFTINGASSINAAELGLISLGSETDAVASRLEPASNAYAIGYSSVIEAAQEEVRPPELYRVTPANSMVNGVLSDDLTLRLSLDSGTYAGGVTVLASVTNGEDAGTTANTGAIRCSQRFAPAGTTSSWVSSLITSTAG